jgi:uncharacterized protein (DUF2225 family)
VVQLTDQHDQNIAALHLDLRYISKKELLDLMYSPKQLAQNQLERKEEEKHVQSRVSSVVGETRTEKDRKLYELLRERSMGHQMQFNRQHSPVHRYR